MQVAERTYNRIRAVELWEMGLCVSQIATRLGISRRNTHAILTRAVGPRRRRIEQIELPGGGRSFSFSAKRMAE